MLLVIVSNNPTERGFSESSVVSCLSSLLFTPIAQEASAAAPRLPSTFAANTNIELFRSDFKRPLFEWYTQRRSKISLEYRIEPMLVIVDNQRI